MAQFNASLRIPFHPLFQQPGVDAQADQFFKSCDFSTLALNARRPFPWKPSFAERAGNELPKPMSSSIHQMSSPGSEGSSKRLENRLWELNLSTLHEKYFLDELTGEGNFGKVYLGRRREDGAVKAIKISQVKSKHF